MTVFLRLWVGMKALWHSIIRIYLRVALFIVRIQIKMLAAYVKHLGKVKSDNMNADELYMAEMEQLKQLMSERLSPANTGGRTPVLRIHRFGYSQSHPTNLDYKVNDSKLGVWQKTFDSTEAEVSLDDIESEEPRQQTDSPSERETHPKVKEAMDELFLKIAKRRDESEGLSVNDRIAFMKEFTDKIKQINIKQEPRSSIHHIDDMNVYFEDEKH